MISPRTFVKGCIGGIAAILLYMSPAIVNALVVIASIIAALLTLLSICVYFVWVCIGNEWQSPVKVIKEFLQGLGYRR